jgi:dolichyl-phosphate beta-glucosyltransferase
MFLSLVIPAYNEESAIRAGKLNLARDWLRSQDFEGELIVVDDESQDETAALAEQAADRVVRIPHGGKAAAVTAGILAAGGEMVLFCDMDQATPIAEAARLVAALQSGADVAVGSRGILRKGAPPGRYLMSWVQSALKFLLLGLTISDTQCGFKAFKRASALEILKHLVVYAPKPPGALRGPSVTSGFDVEMLFVARRLGLVIRELPVEWNYKETRRVSLLRDAYRGLRDLALISYHRLMGEYKFRQV